MKKSEEHIKSVLPFLFNVQNLSLEKDIPQILCIVAPYPFGPQIKEQPLDKQPIKPGLRNMIFYDFSGMTPKS